MNKKEFEKLIKSYQGIDNTINDLYSIGIDMTNSNLVENMGIMLSICIDEVFNSFGADLIDSFLFDVGGSPKYAEIDGKDFPYNTMDELWEIVKNEMK